MRDNIQVRVLEHGIGAPGEFKAEFWVNNYGPYIGSTFPDNVGRSATIYSGEYPFKVARYHGYKALLLDDGGDLPITTLKNPNPNSSANQGLANEIFVHRGYRNAHGTTPAEKGSEGCFTLRYSHPWTDWDDFIRHFEYGDKGTISVWRAIDGIV